LLSSLLAFAEGTALFSFFGPLLSFRSSEEEPPDPFDASVPMHDRPRRMLARVVFVLSLLTNRWIRPLLPEGPAWTPAPGASFSLGYEWATSQHFFFFFSLTVLVSATWGSFLYSSKADVDSGA